LEGGVAIFGAVVTLNCLNSSMKVILYIGNEMSKMGQSIRFVAERKNP